MAPIEDSWRRLERARKHFESFTGQWRRLTSPDSFRVTTNYESDGSYTLKFAIDNPTYTEMPLILGEFFYQLRAALDGAVLTNALARNPAVRETSVEFVIAPDPKEFESKRYKLKFLSPDLQKIMHLLIQRHLPDSARIWAY